MWSKKFKPQKSTLRSTGFAVVFLFLDILANHLLCARKEKYNFILWPPRQYSVCVALCCVLICTWFMILIGILKVCQMKCDFHARPFHYRPTIIDLWIERQCEFGLHFQISYIKFISIIENVFVLRYTILNSQSLLETVDRICCCTAGCPSVVWVRVWYYLGNNWWIRWIFSISFKPSIGNYDDDLFDMCIQLNSTVKWYRCRHLVKRDAS